MPAAFGLVVTTIPAADGMLSLSLPSGEAAPFGAPDLVNGLSVTTGALAQVRVSDERVVSRPGWDLVANVTDFVNEANSAVTIGNRQVGLAPALVSSPAADIAIATAQVAGAAHYPAAFASAAPREGVGDTVLSGVLTVVSPADKPAGTYRAVFTLTVISR